MLEQVQPVIDPNQHTALVTGRVENPTGDLNIGQSVTATVALPPPAGQLELPTDAVVEDGRESVVFVQPPGSEQRFVRTKVQVVRRFRDGICVQAGGALKAGDRVVTGGSLLLRDAMDELPVPAE
jgi:cobalt-zinc-cadmium efflux system membrane fusion protein